MVFANNFYITTNAYAVKTALIPMIYLKADHVYRFNKGIVRREMIVILVISKNLRKKIHFVRFKYILILNYYLIFF